jgi:endonuclease YncB( thermonuclease family)
MEKRKAFFLALILTLALYNISFVSESLKSPSLEKIRIVRIIDGDTLELENNKIVRLVNINTPEKSDALYEKSFLFLKSFENQSVNVEFLGKDKYNRHLARIYSPDYLNLEIVSEGLGSKFLVQNSELDLFNKAENLAVENQKGIWKHSKYFGCFSVEIDKKDEYLTLTNNCEKINLFNWKIKDESRKIFSFPETSSKEITLYSSKGNSNNSVLFWNNAQDIWNNDRDTLYLFDEFDKIVLHYSYGY